MKRFKIFTEHQIVDNLESRGSQTLLRQLQTHKRHHKTESDNNPVKRGCMDDPIHWRYSSARNYARLPGLVDVVTDWG